MPNFPNANNRAVRSTLGHARGGLPVSSIRSSTGLISGLDISQISSALVARQQAAITKIEQRGAQFSAQQTALTGLEATVLTLQTSAQSFTRDANFERFSVSGAGDSIGVTAGSEAVPGDYAIRSVRLASTHSVLSKGFASPSATIGPGTITVRTGGELQQDILLEALNGGAGVQGGTVRITNRDGQSADVDLSGVVTVNEAIDAINNAGVGVSISASDDRFVLTDTSGGTGNLVVEDLSGNAAADLGIVTTAAADSVTGSSVFSVTEDFSFDFLEGGLKPRTFEGLDDLRITATDGTQIDVDLSDATTLGEIVDAINNDADNGGKVTAQLSNGRLELNDTVAGGGTLTVTDLNDASVIEAIGLDTAAVGTTITGRRLSAGLNSSLLRSLNGGAGIDTLGQLSLTDRTGETATLDLSSAETLQEVIDAINGATSVGLVELQITAEINETGTGITLTDTSAGGGNLVVADTTGTLATDLGIAVNSAISSVESGSLNRRFVNEATSIAKYAPDGEVHDPGQIQITDSAGNTSAINISSAVETIGDVIQRINADTTIQVTAELNETGDGFVLIDEAGGAGTLTVAEIDGTTAADLRLLDDAYTGGDGKQRISSRFAAVVDVDSDDTLEDIVTRINESVSFASAALLDDGSRLNPSRLSITSTQSGSAGRLIIESDLDLGLFNTANGQDAVASVGAGTGVAFLVTSETNSFQDIIADLDVTLLSESSTADVVTVDPDFGSIKTALSSFVENFNSFNEAVQSQTRFDAATEQRGVLFGDGFVLRTQSRFNTFVNGSYGESGNAIRNLAALGISFNDDGSMSFDQGQFETVADASPDALVKFFDGDEGFGTQLETLIEDLTDTVSGGFTVQKNALQRNVDDTEERVETLTARMLAARERYLAEFARMESILASLDTQSNVLTEFASSRSG